MIQTVYRWSNHVKPPKNCFLGCFYDLFKGARLLVFFWHQAVVIRVHETKTKADGAAGGDGAMWGPPGPPR